MSSLGARGEAILKVGDTEHRILFTNRALAEAESAMGKSIILVAQGFAAGAAGVSEVSKLLAAGLEAARKDARAGGRTLTVNDAFQVMDQVGFAEAARAVMEAVSAVLSYSQDRAEARPDESPNH